MMLTDDEMFERMKKGWRGGVRHDTICGAGSIPHYTKNARAILPIWCEQYNLLTVNDAGAGDLRWKMGIQWRVEYRPFDLIVRHPSVTALDITTETMPRCDLIVCRAVLNHLDGERVAMALDRFRASGRYLAATQYDKEALPADPKAFWRLDLRRYLGDYLEAVPDLNHGFSKLALWKLE